MFTFWNPVLQLVFRFLLQICDYCEPPGAPPSEEGGPEYDDGDGSGPPLSDKVHSAEFAVDGDTST